MKKTFMFLWLSFTCLVGCQKQNPVSTADHSQISTTSTRPTEVIHLLALSENGEVIEKKWKKAEYEAHVQNLVQSVQESTLPTLQKASKGEQWGLRTVIVGIGLKIDLSVGPLASFGFTPGLRFAFSNSSKPNVP